MHEHINAFTPMGLKIPPPRGIFRESKPRDRRSALLHNRPDCHLTLHPEAVDAIFDIVLNTYSPTPSGRSLPACRTR